MLVGPVTDTNGTSIFTNLFSGAAYNLIVLNNRQIIINTNVGFPNGLSGNVNAAPYQGQLGPSNTFNYSITNWSFQIFQPSNNITFTTNNGVIFISSTGGGGGTTNIATATNNGLLSSNDWSAFNGKQAGSANLTNWAGLSTNAVVYLAQLSALSNSLGSAAFSNSSAFQPATANGTNWSNVATNSVAYLVHLSLQSNWAIATFQPTNANLTKLSTNDGNGLTNFNIAQTKGGRTIDDGSYFGDINHISVAPFSTFPAASYAGQFLTLYDSTLGGNAAGQEAIAGDNLTWRRDRQFGRTAIFETNVGTPDALFVRGTNGQDNVITIQNMYVKGYSAMRYLDMLGNEVGANGWGNSNAAFYVKNNFLEDLGNNSGYYFASTGHLNGGLQKATGAFVWYDGTAGTNDATANIVFRVASNGLGFTTNTFAATNYTYGYGNANMHSGAGNPIAVIEGTRLYLDPNELDPNGIVPGTNVNLVPGLGSGGGVGTGYEFITAGSQIGFRERRYGLYVTLGGNLFMYADPSQQLSFDNVQFPSAIIVGGTTALDTTSKLQVDGNAAMQGVLTLPLLIVTNGITDNGPTTNRMAVWINHTLSNAPSITDGQIYVADAATAGGLKATNFPSGSSSNITGGNGITVTPGGGNAAVSVDTSIVAVLNTAQTIASVKTFSTNVIITNIDNTVQTPLDIEGSTNNFYQVFIRNTNNGTVASTDLIIGNDRSSASSTSNFLDIGINSSGFTAGSGLVGNPNDVYIFGATNDTNILFGTQQTNGGINFWIGPTNVMTMSTNGVVITNNLTVQGNQTNKGLLTVAGAISATGGNNITASGAFIGQGNLVLSGGTSGGHSRIDMATNGDIGLADGGFAFFGKMIFGPYTTAGQPFISATNTGSAANVSFGTTQNSYSGAVNIATGGTITTINGLIVGNATNPASFTLVNTNWLDGQLYTNNTGRPIQVWSPCTRTPASFVGVAGYSVRAAGVTTNDWALTTLVGTLVMPETNRVGPIYVPAGSNFVFTNISSGTGNSATIVNGGQYMVF